MDTARSIAAEPDDVSDVAEREDLRMDPPPVIGGDERRMHVRAYNFWVSLLGGRHIPLLDALDPAQVSDFGDHGVLLDFTRGPADVAIRFLGEAIRAEGGITAGVADIAAVPDGTLLTRLIAPYAQIVTNRAPVGFEAEFVNVHGNHTLYRGILLPFSSNAATIDHVYAVINWKEMVGAADTLLLAGEVRTALASAPARMAHGGGAPSAPWADGPSSRLLDAGPMSAGSGDAAAPRPEEGGTAAAGCGVLDDHLAPARGTIGQLRSADLRTRSALYRALGQAYDFACAARAEPESFAAILAEAGIRARPGAPMPAIVRLIFGADHDPARLAEFAAVLSHAQRLNLPVGGLRRLLEGQEGGLRAIIAAERNARRAERLTDSTDEARETLRRAKPQATFKLADDAGDDEFALLLARRLGEGRLGVLAALPADEAAIDRALRRVRR